MLFSRYPKIVPTLAAFVLLLIPALNGFLGQTSQPSVTPSASPQTVPTVSKIPLARPSPSPVPGAQNFHQWGSITLFNGLPSDSVRAIAQTKDGVMWFGTDNGLARFDGRRIQNLSLGDTDSNRILALKTADSGELWIGTQKGAFVYTDSGPRPVAGTAVESVRAILIGDEVLIGTDNGQVLRVRIDEKAGTFAAEKLFPGAFSAPVTSLVQADGKLLAGTFGGGVWEIKDERISELPSTPRPTFINAIAASENGKLWFGTDAKKGASGIDTIETGSRAKSITASTANVVTLETNDGGLWAGTARYGMFHVVDSKVKESYTFENTSGGLRSDTIFAIFTDREGVIWIGTNRGVSRFDPTGPIQKTVSDIPNSNFIRTFFTSGDGRTLYAGSNRGLFQLDGERWKTVPGFGEKVVYAIGPTADGMVVGTPTGVFDSRGNLLSSGDTRSFAMFQGETYAAIVGRGVIDLTDDQKVVFPDETAYSLFAGPDRMWIGTAGNGLFSFDGTSVKIEAAVDVLKSGTIWKITSDADGNIWLAGEHGAFRFRDGKAEQVIAADDVRDIFVSGPDVWAATTTRGLLHARFDERLGWLLSALGFEQGLPSEKTFSIVSNDGLLIATNRGVVTYHPHSVSPTLIPIRILSQRFHDLSEVRSNIALDYPQNSLLVEVAGQSSRTFPEEFQYFYLLRNSKGMVINQRMSNDPQYAPSDLSPGDYTVESRAFDRDLNASDPLVIRFSIAKAPFPLTATALGVLLAIALIALIWAIIERRRIALNNRELAAARFDLANEAERERSRIARDLHDQTLADLRNLMMMSDRLSPPNAEFRSEIESVSTEIRRICEDLSPSVLENVGLVAALEFLLGRTADDHRFTTSEDANELVTFPLIMQLHIYRIAQEILTNIKQHSTATLVEMNVEITDDGQFLLAIRDNGSPFLPDASKSNGRGISNIRSRASLIDVAISWEQPPEGGNLFSLEIAGKTSG